MTNPKLTINQLIINNKVCLRHLLLNNFTLLLIWSLLIINLTLPVIAATTFDPMSIGVGARALGMGKAYVAVAEQSDTIFTNPAGLGEIDMFEVTSMSGSLLEDVQYLVLGGVYPLGNRTAIGIGYVGAGVGGIEMRDSVGTFQKFSHFGSNVLFVSLGKKLNQKTSVGLNLKYFVQNGSENQDANGAGINLDLGILQKDLSFFSLGLVAQNILSSGKIKYNTGVEEDLPQTIKIGTQMFLLGQKFNSARLSPIELTVALDADLSLSSSKPVLLHFGAELSPVSYLTLRAGIDQNSRLATTQNDFTAGISLKFVGVGFHYAYHNYSDSGQNTAHFISLTLDERGWPYEGLPDTFIGSR
ncbi:hypothetical protein A2291_07445 [candidate division WOR-1 bacterium RIFOXYB2_FULL_42_35]|uniref:PorV/PorQ family protein n=1 Tax=candidate division WOR-1 bacterium RIFOXYC2_FULL_41_25 TaxID=1802586 RepID=A0A1F4TKA5_UNCSA|nr:MAG: hypothetical protein A2247_04305 [candidate division WOR-1 bacterium RIFOXYA2_FULL_41_14]OGC22740.1 MAG: hypothetical protein A2291_07445 [candidate division WOR-1 bacterium RIFOXYB2_FULL_42_35]OGC33161.1 MAG: hypothetical protein A2462_06340 [candidate division WOR-1 bacterium RIFOXYC2_FULL_41_25]